jgi:hypothetical protein
MSIRGHLGNYNTATSRTHVRFTFTTHEAAGANVAPSSAFEAADLRIYKATDGAALSATQRSSASGITMTSPFDSLTGVHSVTIDLTDNTDAGFFSSGCYYEVMLCPDETIDGQTITGVCLCSFEVGVPAVNMVQLGGDAQSATDLKDLADTGYDPATHVAFADLRYITGDDSVMSGLLDMASNYGSNGYLHASLAAIMNTDLTQGASGRLAGAFSTMFNVASPVFTVASVNQTADHAANITAILEDTGTTLPAAIPSAATNATAVWANGTRALTDKAGFALSASGLDLVIIETGITGSAALTNDTGTQLTEINARQLLSLCGSILVGVLSGASGSTNTFKQAGKPAGNSRVVATVDSTGRTALTLKVPD